MEMLPEGGNDLPAAHEITVAETLALLDTDYAGFANGIARRDYVLWLGSGISLERVVGVRGVIARVLEYLREHRDPANPDCRYNRALEEILTELTPPELALVDLTQPVANWPADHAYAVLTRLAGRYSQVLNTRLDGEAEEDFLLWTAVDVPNTFTAEDPDVEHLCIIMLAMEGVFTDISSANWDYLIEAAERELAGAGQVLDICIRAADFQNAAGQARLLKFHGCAARAADNPAVFRQLLIARVPQIVTYRNNPDYGVMRHHLVGLIHQRRTLMVGFSAQDTDVQDIFGEARVHSQWSWAQPPTAFVFAEDQLSQGQKVVLDCVYPADYQAHRAAIETAARLRAFGKPLLLALLLTVYELKLCALCDLAVPAGWDAGARAALHTGLRRLRDRAAGEAEPERLSFVRSLVQCVSTALNLYHQGSPDPDGRYYALSNAPLQQTAMIPASTGLRQAAALLALLGRGDADGTWAIRTANPAAGETSALVITAGGRVTPVYVAANDDAAVTMIASGLFDPEDDEAMLVLSASPAERRQRSPVSAPGRTGRHALREVSMSTLIADAQDDTDLMEQFKRGAAL